jgi:hypothetical protein
MLILKRREVKRLMKSERDPAKLADYDIRQKVSFELIIVNETVVLYVCDRRGGTLLCLSKSTAFDT